MKAEERLKKQAERKRHEREENRRKKAEARDAERRRRAELKLVNKENRASKNRDLDIGLQEAEISSGVLFVSGCMKMTF